jgi:long-chain acyl-CoA synthetase
MHLGNLLEEKACRIPRAPALISGSTWVSYEELNRTATALGGWLLDQGLRPGDRLAIYWSNSLEAVKLFFACFKAGVIAVPINIRLKAPEIAYLLQHSEAAMCFTQPELAGIAEQAVSIGGRNTPLHSKLPQPAPYPLKLLPEIDASDICAIFYTSGTTARPKGVTHTHASLLHVARLMLAMIGDAGPVSMTTTQMAHMSGVGCILLPSMLSGMAVVLLPSFDPVQALDLIERFGVTYTGALPPMAAMMIEEQSRRPRDVHSLKAFISGGDSVPVSLQERFVSAFGLPILELIGMTESCPTAWNTANDLRPGSVGKPRSGVEVKIVALDGSEAEAGEMAVRSPANFRGYWQDPAATARTLRDGWLYTGDLVRRDEDGYLWFAGRLKQIIVRGGSNIAPQEVEEVLLQHPAALEAGVIGMPDSQYGQKVAAFVALRDGRSVSEPELREFVRRRLADYKVPEHIWFLPELPKGLTGKVDRRALAEFASSQPDAPRDVLEARV